MSESELDITLPEPERLPVKPRYRLWFCLSLFTTILVIGALFFLFPELWGLDPIFLSVICLSLFSFLFAIRINVFERKLNFSSTWNSAREKYINELINVRQRALSVSRLIILTSNGGHGNAQLVWQNRSQLQFVKNKAIKRTEICLPDDKVTSAEQRGYKILDILMHSIAGEINLQQISECSISHDGLMQESIIKEKCQNYGLDRSHILVVDNKESDTLLNRWMQDTKSGERLLIVLNTLSDTDNSAEIALLFVFSYTNNKLPKIHRSVEYTNQKSSELALMYGDINVQDIEAVWCSGVDDYLCSQVMSALTKNNVDIAPRIINIDDVFGYSDSVIELFSTALATEWVATSHKPQLILTHNKKTVIRVVCSS